MQMLVEADSRARVQGLLAVRLPLLHGLRSAPDAAFKGVQRRALDFDPLAV
ncbi:MAG TPA: hypothetical protein VLT62_16315 [Candidatus Methylomirabilis sp.]|nr:hypothetical protein [Candidatus Methylomirabilis sp.]